jgi:hypothetical protein
VQSVGCKDGGVLRGEGCVGYEVRIVECEVSSVKCKVWSVKCKGKCKV